MHATPRLLRLTAITVVLMLVAPLSAHAAWPSLFTLEKYSGASGARTWSRPLTAMSSGISTDASGSVYLCTDKGYDVVNSAGTKLIRSVNIKGSGWGLDVCVAPNGQVYVLDPQFGRVQRYSKSGKFLSWWGSIGTIKNHFDWPHAITADSKSNIYVADATGRIQKFTSTGKYVRTIAGRGKTAGTAGKFISAPNAIACDATGTLYAVEGSYTPEESSPDRVQKFSCSTGQYKSAWKGIGGNDIAINRFGQVFIAPYDDKTTTPCVRRFSTSGKLKKTYTGALPDVDGLAGGSPWGIAVDRLGNFITVCYGAG